MTTETLRGRAIAWLNNHMIIASEEGDPFETLLDLLTTVRREGAEEMRGIAGELSFRLDALMNFTISEIWDGSIAIHISDPDIQAEIDSIEEIRQARAIIAKFKALPTTTDEEQKDTKESADANRL